MLGQERVWGRVGQLPSPRSQVGEDAFSGHYEAPPSAGNLLAVGISASGRRTE